MKLRRARQEPLPLQLPAWAAASAILAPRQPPPLAACNCSLICLQLIWTLLPRNCSWGALQEPWESAELMLQLAGFPLTAVALALLNHLMSAIAGLSAAGRGGPGPSWSPDGWLTCPTRVHSEALCSESPVALETVGSDFLLSKWKPPQRPGCSMWGVAFPWVSSMTSEAAGGSQEAGFSTVLGEPDSQESPGSLLYCVGPRKQWQLLGRFRGLPSYVGLGV